MFLRGGAFEFGVPAVHLLFRETAGTHDGNPFFFRDHVCLSQRPRAQQLQNGMLMGAQRFNFGVQFNQAPFQDPRGGSGRIAARPRPVVLRIARMSSRLRPALR